MNNNSTYNFNGETYTKDEIEAKLILFDKMAEFFKEHNTCGDEL